MVRMTLFVLLFLPNLVHASLIVQSAAFESPATSDLVAELCSDRDEDGDLFGSCSTSFDYGDGRNVEAFASGDAITGQFKNSLMVSSSNPPGGFLSGAWGGANALAQFNLTVEEAGTIEFFFGYDGIITSDSDSFAWSVLTSVYIDEVVPESENGIETVHGIESQAVSDLSSFFIFNAQPENKVVFSSPGPTMIENLLTFRFDLEVGTYQIRNHTFLEGRVSNGMIDMDFTNTSEFLMRPITARYSFDNPLILSQPALQAIPEPSSILIFLIGLMLVTLANSRRNRSKQASAESHFGA